VNTDKTDKRTEYKIPKKDGPAPGLYNIEDAIVRTQWINHKPAMDKQKIVGFIDKITKVRKIAPGVGTY
jgi:hypothetical protein